MLRCKASKLFEIEGHSDDAMWYVITIRDNSGQVVDTIREPTQCEAFDELQRKGYEY
jgi:hypothetical protein